MQRLGQLLFLVNHSISEVYVCNKGQHVGYPPVPSITVLGSCLHHSQEKQSRFVINLVCWKPVHDAHNNRVLAAVFF